MTLIGVASPKGGVAKSSITVNLASVAAAAAPDLDVAVIDADENGTAEAWIEAGGDLFAGVRVSTATSPRVLRRLRDANLPLAFVDLPGARRGGEMRALLTGTDGEPVCDALLVPSQLTRADLHPVVGAVVDDIGPSGIPYRLVLTKVPTRELVEAHAQVDALRAQGIDVADTVIRHYSAWIDSNNKAVPLSAIGGRDDRARQAEDDLRALAREALDLAGVDVPIPDTDRSPRRQRLVALTASAAHQNEEE